MKLEIIRGDLDLMAQLSKLDNFDQIMSIDGAGDSLSIMKVPDGILVKPRYTNSYTFVKCEF